MSYNQYISGDRGRKSPVDRRSTHTPSGEDKPLHGILKNKDELTEEKRWHQEYSEKKRKEETKKEEQLSLAKERLLLGATDLRTTSGTSRKLIDPRLQPAIRERSRSRPGSSATRQQTPLQRAPPTNPEDPPFAPSSSDRPGLSYRQIPAPSFGTLFGDERRRDDSSRRRDHAPAFPSTSGPSSYGGDTEALSSEVRRRPPRRQIEKAHSPDPSTITRDEYRPRPEPTGAYFSQSPIRSDAMDLVRVRHPRSPSEVRGSGAQIYRAANSGSQLVGSPTLGTDYHCSTALTGTPEEGLLPCSICRMPTFRRTWGLTETFTTASQSSTIRDNRRYEDSLPCCVSCHGKPETAATLVSIVKKDSH